MNILGFVGLLAFFTTTILCYCRQYQPQTCKLTGMAVFGEAIFIKRGGKLDLAPGL